MHDKVMIEDAHERVRLDDVRDVNAGARIEHANERAHLDDIGDVHGEARVKHVPDQVCLDDASDARDDVMIEQRDISMASASGDYVMIERARERGGITTTFATRSTRS